MENRVKTDDLNRGKTTAGTGGLKQNGWVGRNDTNQFGDFFGDFFGF